MSQSLDEQPKTEAWKPVNAISFAVACGFAGLFVALAIQRLVYPFELTWLESYMAAPVLRCLRGESIYQAPSFDYTSGIYPPLYFHLSSCLAQWFGMNADSFAFWPMRAISLLSTLGVSLVMGWLLSTRRRAPLQTAFVLGAMYLASFGRFEGWLDSSRVDALMCLLFFLAMALQIEGRGSASALAAGLCAGLAGLAKQPGLLCFVISAGFLAVAQNQGRRALLAGTAATATVLGYLAATGDLANPYFYYWLFEAPSRHPYSLRNLGLGLGFVAMTMPIVLVMALMPLRRGGTSAWQRFRALPPWSAATALTLVCSLLLRLKQGASINYFLPVLPLAAVAAYDAAIEAGTRHPQTRRYLSLGLLAQLLVLTYNPLPWLPTFADVQAAQRLVASLRAVDGPVWFTTFPSYARLAGKPWVLQDGGRIDLMPSFVESELSKAVADQIFGAVILPDDDSSLSPESLSLHYHALQLPLDLPPFLRYLHSGHFLGRIYVRRDLLPSLWARLQPLYATDWLHEEEASCRRTACFRRSL